MEKSTLGFGKRRLVGEIIKQNWEVDDPYSLKLGLNEILYVIQEMQTQEGLSYLQGGPRTVSKFDVFNDFAKHLLYRNLANYDSMLMVSSEKGCLTDDTVIITDKHELGIKIKDIDYKNFKVLSYNKNTFNFEYKECDGIELVKKDDVYKLVLDNGDVLKGTKDHPILTTKGYKQLIDCEDEFVQTLVGLKKCVSVKYIFSNEKVYDIVNVRDNHNFIANGIVVSNSGKSSFAIMLARAWCKLLGKRFDPKKNIAYSNRDVMTLIDSSDKFDVIIADESVRFCCVEGNTLIQTKDGEVKIKDLVNKTNFEVLSYNEKTKLFEYKKAEKCVKVKDDYVYEIETECGKKIRATKEHKFLTTDGWKKLEELIDNDILILYNKKSLQNPNSVLFPNAITIICDTFKKRTMKIKTINIVKKVPTYDIINVEDNNNYVANGFVVHNSTMDWAKKESKDLRKKIAEVRTKHLLFILCFPLKITKVEKTYMDAFVSYWLDIFGRGNVAVFVKDRNPVNDPWRLKDFKNVGSYTEFTSLPDIEKKLKKHPNFWKLMQFPKPPPWLYNKYLEVREHNVYNEETIREFVTTEDVQKSLLLLALQDIMMNDANLSMNRIALHIKNTYDIPIAKQAIQSIMQDSKQLVNKIREEQIGHK